MPFPHVMRCIEVVHPGPSSKLTVGERPIPELKSGEVLIKVGAAGVNRPDLVQRQGAYPPPPGACDILGLEVAGKIAALGPDAPDTLAIGQEVCALVTGGGYADYCVAAASLCLPFPQGMDAVQAAALPEGFFTVWHNVFQRGRLAQGESLLVHGGGSGIGTVAIQLAKTFGATVFTTAGGPEKCQSCRALGADFVIDYKSEDFVEVVRTTTGGKGVDVILDMVGGDYLPRNLQCLGLEGRHVSIAFLHGPTAEVNFLNVMVKRQTLTGSTLRPQSVANKTAIADDLREKVWPLLDRGRVKPQIYKTFPLEAAEEAHRALNKGDHFGKIILVLDR
jgi:NADPH2:quinone reductase